MPGRSRPDHPPHRPAPAGPPFPRNAYAAGLDRIGGGTPVIGTEVGITLRARRRPGTPRLAGHPASGRPGPGGHVRRTCRLSPHRLDLPRRTTDRRLSAGAGLARRLRATALEHIAHQI
ncbi:hypothetical protein OHA11_32640 [Streptomyces sp. NBC_00878]|nr:hypothetical protein [Streptomyces sp. NBC_00878]